MTCSPPCTCRSSSLSRRLLFRDVFLSALTLLNSPQRFARAFRETRRSQALVFSLAAIVLVFVIPASGQATDEFTCGSFSSSGACGVAQRGAPFAAISGRASVSGAQVLLLPSGTTHESTAIIYQALVPVQSFTSTFRFVPNGQNVAFVLENSNNNPGFDENAFIGGAGCEAGFFQAFGANTPPNNTFALELDSYSPLTLTGSFTYSSAQIYQAGQSPCLPNDDGPHYYPTNKISTSPVALNSPAGSPNTTTGDTYSATLVYSGSTLTLNLYNVTAGGSCPGASCFTQRWTVDIPSWVHGTTAYLGLTAASGLTSNHPLYIKSFSYASGRQSNASTPTFSPVAGKYTSSQAVSISDATSDATVYYTTNGTAPTTSSTRYTGPITVSSTETLKAIAVVAGEANSAVASATYTMTTVPVAAQEAYVYDTLAAGTYVYGVSSSGRLTMIQGSPFRTYGSLVGTNGRFFLTQGSGYVLAYQVEANGGIGKLISKINTQLYSGSECGSSPQGAELDRTGAYVYALLAGKNCSAIQTFEISETGELIFKGSTNAVDGDIGLPTVTGNNKFAYSISLAKGVEGHFISFSRESTGVLNVINAHEANPTPKAGTSAYVPMTNPTPDPTDHFALVVKPQGGGEQQLASYNVNSQGDTTSTNTWENMPALPDYVYDMALDPTGRILAIATGHGVQFFHFNGASPATRFTGIIGASGYIKNMAWDNHGHLYAQNGANGEVYVYEVTTARVTELSGSPTVIPEGTFAVRTK
jgi:hypothetical protein